MSNKSKFHEIRHIETIRELMNGSEELYGEYTAYMTKSKKAGNYSNITFTQFKSDVEALGTKLIEIGLQGENIAIIGNNSYQWVVAYFAIINGAGVVVPLDKELKQEEISNLVKIFCELEFIFHA